MDILCSGSSIYNKVIKYALTKLDYKKKARQEEFDKQKEIRRKNVELKNKNREALNKEREEQIKIIAEAYKRAIDDVSKEASASLISTVNYINKKEE